MPKLLKPFAAMLAGGVALLATAALQPAGAFVLGGTTPGKWGSPTMGTGATITWSLMGSGVDCSADSTGNCTPLSSFMPAGYLTVVQAAFNAWSSVANITFVQVADGGEAFNAATQLSGDIRLGGHNIDNANGVLAHGYYPPANGATAAGDIHFDTSETWSLDLVGPGFSLFQVMTHELGHALGLDHTGVPNSLMNAFYTEAFSGPQADDIAGMQFIYGAPVEVESVPEPASMAVLAGGLLGLGLVRRRKA